MITINLLSSQEKKDISYEKNNISVIGAFVVLSFVFILLGVVLYTIKDLQNNNYLAQASETKNLEKFLNQEGNKQIESKVKEINYYLATIKKIESERTDFSKSLVEIANLTTNGVRLYNIKLHKADKNFEITGQADKRDDLLKFIDNLEKSDYFEGIESPSSNLISPTDISFTIKGKLTDKALKP